MMDGSRTTSACVCVCVCVCLCMCLGLPTKTPLRGLNWEKDSFCKDSRLTVQALHYCIDGNWLGTFRHSDRYCRYLGRYPGRLGRMQWGHFHPQERKRETQHKEATGSSELLVLLHSCSFLQCAQSTLCKCISPRILALQPHQP